MWAKNRYWFLFLAVLECAVMCSTFHNVNAVELSHGVALRQNVLLFRRHGDKNDGLVNEEVVKGPEGAFGVSQSYLRIYEHVKFSRVNFSVEVETRMSLMSSGLEVFGGTISSGSLFGSSKPLEHWDATFEHIDETGTSLRTRLERFNVSVILGSFDIDIGRQPLSLGTSHFVGVLDVIAPFAPGDPDVTYKPGVDAIRMRRGIGMTGEAEIIAVGAKKWEAGAILGRLRLSVKGIDLELVGGRFRRRNFGGIGWEGGIKNFGVWGECAFFERREKVEKIRGGLKRAAFSSVAGIDVNLPVDFKAGGALMYQDFGVRNPDDLFGDLSVYNDAPFREGWVFLASAAYGLITLHRQLHPLVNADMAGLINLVDSSTIWQPMITISVGDNADMSLYGWLGTGDSSSSEFGLMPDGGGFYARWFF